MTADVAVLGGGIIGCSAAAMLAERGLSVTLFEPTAVAAGASGRNLGALQHPFDPVLAPLYHDSLDRYRGLADDDADFALPAEPAGLLLLNADPGAARDLASRLTAMVPDLQPEFLDERTVAEAEPSLTPGFAACRLHTGRPIPPASATHAWARRAERLGAELRIGLGGSPWLEGTALRGVRLDDGSTIPAERVLVAAGPSTPALVDPGGTWEPIRRTWGVTLQLELGAAAPRHIVEEDEVDAVNRPVAAEALAGASDGADPPSLFSLASARGISTLGSTFLPAEPDAERIARLLLERGIRYLPAIAAAPVLEVRSCARPQSADGRPFIGAVAHVDGLFVCAGHGPWGISTGPGSAALAVSAMLDGTAPPPALDANRAAG